MIRDRDAAIQAQATLIDKQNALIDERNFQIEILDKGLKDTSEELEYYKKSKLVKIARKIRILN